MMPGSTGSFGSGETFGGARCSASAMPAILPCSVRIMSMSASAVTSSAWPSPPPSTLTDGSCIGLPISLSVSHAASACT
eukprot:357202-Chlamydomonas_euryale.AAC.20